MKMYERSKLRNLFSSTSPCFIRRPYSHSEGRGRDEIAWKIITFEKYNYYRKRANYYRKYRTFVCKMKLLQLFHPN